MMDDEDLVTACRSRGGPEGAENKIYMIFNNYPRVKEGSDSYYCLVYQFIRYVKSQ